MFGVTRYDPTQASTSATPAAPSNAGLDALKARVASKKAEREAAAAPSEAPQDETPVAAEQTPQSKTPKAKTKAKERYLKKKSNRRKASKKSGGPLTAVSVEEQERKANETPEEKLKRKKALKEARQARRAEAAAAQAQTEESGKAEDPVEEAQADAEIATPEESKEERKARRRADKEAKRARKAQELEDSTIAEAPSAIEVEPAAPEVDDAPKSKKRRKESAPEQESEAASKASASAAKIISKATKASKRSAAAARAAKSDSEYEDEEEPRNVEQLDALPVFRRPAPLAAPDSNLLAELSIAKELSEVYQVDSRATTGFEELSDACALGQNLRSRLAKLDIQQFFAVQSAVLPLLLSPTARHRRRFPWPVRDLCINAPTGSGKTLSYALPIVEQLSSYVGTRKLRALVLLPTKDLVQQLKETFDALILGTDLKVGTATGQLSFPKEQAKLSMRFGTSPVDILIATPGRLMDHIAETPDFSLEDLHFFVVDEADRLLAQSFNDWLPSVMEALHQAMTGKDAESQVVLRPAMLPSRRRKVQKLLLSATLSRDPVQIAALKLHQPLYISISDATTPASEFSLPATLSEHMIICSGALKPLMLVHILQQHQLTHGICFTKSTEAASRLVKLLEFLQEEMRGEPLKVASFSSDLPGKERTKILNAFKAGQISLLVCSDLISRGIDLPQVSHVINYDVPIDLRKYVHRVGRTARAGRTGDAWSLVEAQEAAFFKGLHKQAGRLDKIKRLRVGAEVIDPMTNAYERALARLKEAFVRT